MEEDVSAEEADERALHRRRELPIGACVPMYSRELHQRLAQPAFLADLADRSIGYAMNSASAPTSCPSR